MLPGSPPRGQIGSGEVRCSTSIHVYPRLSTSIHVYPRLSTSIHVYPRLSMSIHVYPRVTTWNPQTAKVGGPLPGWPGKVNGDLKILSNLQHRWTQVATMRMGLEAAPSRCRSHHLDTSGQVNAPKKRNVPPVEGALFWCAPSYCCNPKEQHWNSKWEISVWHRFCNRGKK